MAVDSDLLKSLHAAGIPLAELHLAQFWQSLVDAQNSVVVGADLETTKDMGENTTRAVNFTLTKTLHNLKVRYGHMVTRDKWDNILKEILAFLSTKTLRIAGGEYLVASQGAEHYSHRNRSKINYDLPNPHDVAVGFSVPETLFLWWCAANDPSPAVTRYSSVDARLRTFVTALEDTIRAGNRDNPAGIDDDRLTSTVACRMGFKNKFAESFKEISGARHPDNVYVPDLGGHIRDMGRKFFFEEYARRTPDNQKILKDAIEAIKHTKEQAAILAEVRKIVSAALRNYIPQLGTPETIAERNTIEKTVKDFLENIQYIDIPGPSVKTAADKAGADAMAVARAAAKAAADKAAADAAEAARAKAAADVWAAMQARLAAAKAAADKAAADALALAAALAREAAAREAARLAAEVEKKRALQDLEQKITQARSARNAGEVVKYAQEYARLKAT